LGPADVHISLGLIHTAALALSVSDLARFNDYCAAMKAERPLVADESVDVMLSNCVLNLVRPEDKGQLFEPIASRPSGVILHWTHLLPLDLRCTRARKHKDH